MPWVDDSSAAMVTDLYEITMAAGYLEAGLADEPTTFELSIRRLPPERNFLIAAGLDEFLSFVEGFRFDEASLAYLDSLDLFDERFLDVLRSLRFEGDVWAMPEGTVAFAQEPLLQVTAPLIQAQILETFALAAIGFQTMIASKAARVRLAAGDRTVADFGARRAHGPDAGLKAARAAYIGGVDATSLVLAGRHFGIPVTGTMAHSYVLAHDSELDSFLSFSRAFPHNAVLLIDTFDTLEGARTAVEAARRLDREGIHPTGVRLDSGDVGRLAVDVRRILDNAGLAEIRILASGGLDEYAIRELLARNAPINGFGVGTALTTSGDAPSLDIVYKLVEGRAGPVMKTSTGKLTLPGRKQVYRSRASGQMAGDTLALADEGTAGDGESLLIPVMTDGTRRSKEAVGSLRRRTLEGLKALPERLGSITEPADPPYPVRLSRRLEDLFVSLGGGPLGIGVGGETDPSPAPR